VEDVSACDLGKKGGVFKYGRPNGILNDYSETAELLLDLDEPRPDSFRLAGRYTLLARQPRDCGSHSWC
jgi:hypothetical protein